MLFGLVWFSFMLVLFSNCLRGSLANLVPTEVKYMAEKSRRTSSKRSILQENYFQSPLTAHFQSLTD